MGVWSVEWKRNGLLLLIALLLVSWRMRLVASGTMQQRCPLECDCLDTHVDCSRRSLTSLPAVFPTWTTHLELQGNLIEEINGTAFLGLHNLTALDLSDNEIESFSRLVFAHTPHLQRLTVRKNRLTSVPLGIEALKNLRKLDLKGNQIVALLRVDVARIAKIEVVDLGRNQIREFPPATSLKDSKITKLDLSNNQLSTLKPNTFSVLYSLRNLRLSRNSISSIDKGTFEGLFALRSLDLSRNKLDSIRGRTFAPLCSLQNLSLSRNQIGSLENGAFLGLKQLQRLYLAENHIKSISRGWLFGLESLSALDLSSNELSWLEPMVWSQCPSLEWLSLASNRLHSLPSFLFKKLSHLRHLSLADNHINYLQRSAVNGLDLLISLDLSGNALASCVEDGSAFSNTTLPSLQTLKFASNRIRVVPRDAFEGFPALESLDLTDNPIASIQEDAFGHSPLKNLYINTSSLICDCELKWFPEWLFSTGINRNTISTVCLHPLPLQGIDVAVIDTSNLTCVDSSPRARVLSHPNVLTKALLGSIVRLQCTGYGASPLEISWKVFQDGRQRLLTHDATTEFMFNRSTGVNGSLNDLSVEYLHSEVQLSEITASDEAEYQCIVRNHYGSAYSIKAKIKVLQKPHIHYSPSNVSILKGGNARLRCSAKGIPAPSIKWKKDGWQSFPAALERRLHIKANDDNLYVVNVSMADAGVYTCLVTNEAGHAESSAHIRVYESELRPKMEDQKVRLGATVVFNCTAKIRPAVEIRWLRNEEPINPNSAPSRFAFRATNQVLILSEVRVSDSGMYTCELNAGGETLSRASSNLTVETGWEDSNKRRVDVELQPKRCSFCVIVFACAFSVTMLFNVLFWSLVCYRKRRGLHCYSSVKGAATTPSLEA